MTSIIPFRLTEEGYLAEEGDDIFEHASVYNEWHKNNCNFPGDGDVSDAVSAMTFNKTYAHFFNGGHSAEYWSICIIS